MIAFYLTDCSLEFEHFLKRLRFRPIEKFLKTVGSTIHFSESHCSESR